jgi:hypothetical protein
MATLPERLDRMVELYLAPWTDAGHSEPYPYMTLGNPATDAELDELERAIGRLLPTEAREVYKWHNGCIVWLVPNIGFDNIRMARAIYDITKKEVLPPLSNGTEHLEARELFAIFDVDKPSLMVRTTIGERIPASAVYFLDVDRFTLVSESINGFVEHFIRELGTAGVELTEHGIRWKTESGDARVFDPTHAPWWR